MSLRINIQDTHLSAWETGDWDIALAHRFYDEANSWLASFHTAHNHYTGIAHLISVDHLPKEQLEEIAKKLQEMYDNLQAEFLAKEIHRDEEYEA